MNGKLIGISLAFLATNIGSFLVGDYVAVSRMRRNIADAFQLEASALANPSVETEALPFPIKTQDIPQQPAIQFEDYAEGFGLVSQKQNGDVVARNEQNMTIRFNCEWAYRELSTIDIIYPDGSSDYFVMKHRLDEESLNLVSKMHHLWCTSI